jgi:hypothetical protein
MVTAAARWNNVCGGEDSAVVVQKRWGQQCGVSCGCVLRLEIELDAKERVVAALATTKRILVQTNSSKEPLRPLLTMHRQRPQCISPSPCRALQTLVSAAVHYMPGRYLWQLQNYHEYSSHMRSSGAFCQTVLDQMVLVTPQSPPSLQPSNAPQSTMSYTPCFDLVEDALTALLKGYIAAARCRNDATFPFPTTATALSQDYNYSTDNWLVSSYHFNFDEKNQMNGSSSNSVLGWIQAWWQRHISSWWFNASNTETTSHEYVPRHQSLFQTTHAPRSHARVLHNHTTWHNNNYWTALDWMDWAEQERTLSDQKQAKSSRTLFTDWISYVDTQEQNGRRQRDRHERQSA